MFSLPVLALQFKCEVFAFCFQSRKRSSVDGSQLWLVDHKFALLPRMHSTTSSSSIQNMQILRPMTRESSLKRFNTNPAEFKRDDLTSRLSDDLQSIDVSSDPIDKSSDHSSQACSTFTGVTRQTNATLTSLSCIRSPLSPDVKVRRRKMNKSSLRLKAFKSKADVPSLDFEAAGLVGREKEISTLRSCYERLMSDGKKELILVGGESGLSLIHI